MRLINTELLKPSNAIAIILIIAISNWIIHHVFAKHVIDERKRARFSRSPTSAEAEAVVEE